MLAAGACYFLGFVGFGLWPLTFVALPLAIAVVERLSGRSQVGAAVAFGAIALSGGFYWVVHLLEAFAYLPWPVAVVGYLLLITYQGLALALTVLGVVQAERRLGVSAPWALMVLWPTLESAVPAVFPHWVGAGFYRFSWLTQVVDLTGMPGLTLWVAAVSGAVLALGRAAARRRWSTAAPACAVAAASTLAIIAYGVARLERIDARIERAPTLEVGLVQTNLGAGDLRKRSVPLIETHQKMTAALVKAHPGVALVVWPESAYDRVLSRRITDVKSRVLPAIDVPLLFGASTYERSAGVAQIYNSAILTDASGRVVDRFDKIRLLPFGETIPFAETFPIIKTWIPTLMTPGRDYAPLVLGQLKLLPMVCYEDILPAFVRRMWREGGPVELLVNITNDSWYGDSHEPLIHLVLASFRSIETRRSMIRSTNTGISAIIDPAGRIVARTGQWTQEILVYDIPTLAGHDTTVFIMLGPVIVWAGGTLILAGLFFALRAAWRRPAGRVQAAAVGLAGIAGAAGCARAEIPYDYGRIPAAEAPRHELRVAVTPLVDGRRPDERPGGSDRFVYRGVEYVGTVLEDLSGAPVHRVTEVLARHLARRRTFAQVMLVLNEAQAPNADLFLDGRILRLRGYVEAHAPEEKSGRAAAERRVLAEVVLEDLRLRTPDGRVLLHADAGWTVLETRKQSDESPLDPWAIMSEALQVALTDFADLVEGADLSGAFEVRPKVELSSTTSSATAEAPFGDLATRGPYGWSFERDEASPPVGWRGEEACAAASLYWRQTKRFHRVTGPYRPRVRLWACAPEAAYRLDHRVEFPADLLGHGGGARYFYWALGETNWPNAAEQLRRGLGLRAPSSRYIFEVGGPRASRP